MRGWVLVLSGVVLVVAWVVSRQPIPAGFSYPWLVKRSLTGLKLAVVLVDTLEYVGLTTRAGALRWLTGVVMPKLKLPNIKVSSLTFDGVPVQMYYPHPLPTTAADGAPAVQYPGVVYIHGGGWSFGSPDDYSPITGYLALHLPGIVVSVDYRLAPEHAAPAGLEDCLRAAKHFLSRAATYRVDPANIIIAGDSAGGNLAAAVTLALRDERFAVRPAGQVLIYPVTQLVDLQTPSYQQYGHNSINNIAEMSWFMAAYVSGLKLQPKFETNTHVSVNARQKFASEHLNHDLLPVNQQYSPYIKPDKYIGCSQTWSAIEQMVTNPYVSPLLAGNLTELPRAYVYTCQHDVLRDDGILYTRRLKRDGNDVVHENDEVCIHGKMNFLPDEIPEASRDLDRIIDFMKECFHPQK